MPGKPASIAFFALTLLAVAFPAGANPTYQVVGIGGRPEGCSLGLFFPRKPLISRTKRHNVPALCLFSCSRCSRARAH